MLRSITDALLHLAFPHVCEGCGRDLQQRDHFLCISCRENLPRTDFHYYPNNPVEKMFWGRVALTSATAQFYFTRNSLVQRLMHEFKYRGNQELGFYLGQMMGEQLLVSNRFRYIDGLVPLPLFSSKKRKRGFNQAEILCNGIASVLQVPVYSNLVARTMNTESQTKKNRADRWLNMKGRFVLKDPEAARGKHLLLVDDVVTTGATLEACSSVILEVPEARVSLATLCISSSS